MPQLRVLIVDDNEPDRSLLATVLGAAGFSVRTAADGVAAFHACAAFTPELIVLDFELPELDGTEVARRLKANEATRCIPVLGVSARGANFSLQALAAGADDYLPKPIHLGDLRHAVLRLLRAAGRSLVSIS